MLRRAHTWSGRQKWLNGGAVAVVLVSFGTCIPLSALGDSAKTSRGVTADGRVVVARHKTSPPWAKDIIKGVKPQLPPSESAKQQGGEGFYRVMLNLGTGTVRDVVVVRSSGSRAIDSSVVHALRQWTLRPGKWKEFEIHIAMSTHPSR